MAGFTTCSAHSSINLLLLCYLAGFKTDAMIDTTYHWLMKNNLVKQNCKLVTETEFSLFEAAATAASKITGGMYLSELYRDIYIAYDDADQFIGYVVDATYPVSERVFIDKDRIWKRSCTTESGYQKCSYGPYK